MTAKHKQLKIYNMKKEIVDISKELGIKRITTLDERWYVIPGENVATGLPEHKFLPSITWIAGCYPKGIYFYKWLAEHGWDEAEAIKKEAGERGSKVHYACSDIDRAMEIAINAKYINPTTGQPEELSQEEVDAIMSYIKFVETYKPHIFADELTGFGEFYGGTLDKIFAIGELRPGVRQIYITDLKTSANIWESHKLQVSAQSRMNIDYIKLGITDEEWSGRKLSLLQIGYKRNKDGYKFTEIEDVYEDFVNIAYGIWKKENNGSKPAQKDYPLILKSDFRVAQAKALQIPEKVDIKKKKVKE